MIDMEVNRKVLKRFMDSFGLKFDFIPERKIVEDHDTIFCIVVNMYKGYFTTKVGGKKQFLGDFFEKEFRICNRLSNKNEWNVEEGYKKILVDNLRNTIFSYLGAVDVAEEMIKMSQEYSEELIRKGHFDD